MSSFAALRFAPRLLTGNASHRLVAAATQRNSYFTYSNQISQPLEREPKYTTAEEAVKVIKSGNAPFMCVSVDVCASCVRF